MTTLGGGPLEIIDGDRGANYPKQQDFATTGHCLFLNAGNVTTNGFNFSDCAFISAEKDSVLRKGKLRRNDIVLTTRGTVGNVAYFDKSVPYDHIRINSGMVIFRVQPKELWPRFLYLFLRSFIFRSQVESLRTGSAQPQLPIRDINQIKIPVPPLKEQQAIACILGALDDKIELNRRMNRTLEEIARAIFKSWFVDFDPVHAKAAVRSAHLGWTNEQISRAACPNLKPEIAALFPDSFEDSELGEIPKGWEVKPLEEIAEFLNGLALQEYPPRDGRALPVIKIAQLRNGDTQGADICSADLPSEYIVNDGDTLFSWSGSLECVIWTGGKGGLNQHLFRVTSDDYPKWFLYFWIHEHLPEFRYIASSKATTMGHIQRHHLHEAKVVVPSAQVMEPANAAIALYFEQILQLRLQSRTLAALRDALLPKLISGELRVPDAERIVGRAL
jgi:type I restriction enzyme S subunit